MASNANKRNLEAIGNYLYLNVTLYIEDSRQEAERDGATLLKLCK